MTDKPENGSTDFALPVAPHHVCPFLEKAKMDAIEKHFAELSEMRDMQSASGGEMNKLVASQVSLNSTLVGISKNLENGFELGKKVIQLFGWIVLVFVFVVVVFGVLFVYVTKTQLEYKDFHITPYIPGITRQYQPQQPPAVPVAPQAPQVPQFVPQGNNLAPELPELPPIETGR